MGQELIKSNPGSFAITPVDAEEHLKQVQAVIKDLMKKDLHYGVIPGAGKKPTLLKPGAELLLNLYQFFPRDVEIIEKEEQWDVVPSMNRFPLFRYLVRVTIYDKEGNKVAVGLGECNSYESKYRWRDSKRVCPVCGKEAIIKGKEEYGGGWLCFEKKGGCKAKFKTGDPQIEGQVIGRSANEDIFDIVNTLVKMAKKRALIDATLTATRTSGDFTQDIEDFKGIASLPEAEYEDVSEKKAKNSDGLALAGDATKEVTLKPGEKVNVKTGEVSFDRDVVPVGLYKGKKFADLTGSQKTGLLKWMNESGEAKNFPEFMTFATGEQAGDAFGGAFDQPVRPPEDEVSQVEETVEEKDKALAEVKEVLSTIAPGFLDPKPKLTADEKALLSKLTKEVYGAATWVDLKQLRASTIRSGLEKLVAATKREFDAMSKSTKKKGAK